MTRLSESITSPVSRSQAFAYVADWSRQAEWDPNTVSSARIDDGAHGVGARYVLEVRMGSRSVPMEYRITELESPARIVLIGEGSGIWAQDVISFTETATGTRVDYEAEIRLSGMLGLVQPLLGKAFARIAKGAVEGLQRELDAIAARAAERAA